MATTGLLPIAELGIAGATFDDQEHNIHNRSDRAISPHRPQKGRFKAYLSNLKKAILKGPGDTQSYTPSDTWCVPATLLVGKNKKHEHKWEAVLALDSQCTFNLISTLTLERENLVIEYPEVKHLATTITGQQIDSLGHIDIRVWCRVKVKPLLGGQPTFKPKYYKMRFLVVKSNNFEAIVGHKTMEEQHIYKDKDIICPFRPAATATGDTAAQQHAADERRRLESLRVQQDEKRKADEQHGNSSGL